MSFLNGVKKRIAGAVARRALPLVAETVGVELPGRIRSELAELVRSELQNV